jgi:hypothetical protein
MLTCRQPGSKFQPWGIGRSFTQGVNYQGEGAALYEPGSAYS